MRFKCKFQTKTSKYTVHITHILLGEKLICLWIAFVCPKEASAWLTDNYYMCHPLVFFSHHTILAEFLCLSFLNT